MATLPDTVQELVDLIGEDQAIRLMAAYSKTVVEIPRNPDKARKLQQILSMESVVKLCGYYHGERVYMPDAANLIKKYRDLKIQELKGKKSVNQLARQYNLSYRRIQQIQAEVPADDSQIGFDF